MGSGLLTQTIRDAVGSDPELQEWREKARQRRLPKVAQVRLPVPFHPARFSQAALGAMPRLPAAPNWTGATDDPWPGWLQANIARRLAWIFAGVFDSVRRGERLATGFLPASGGRVPVPRELFDATTVTLELRTCSLVAGSAVLFLDVTVDQPARSASRAAIDRFVVNVDQHMAAAGRCYTLAEAVEMAHQALGSGVSACEVEAALGRASVVALAGRGRRSAAVTPTLPELRAAAERAAEIAP